MAAVKLYLKQRLEAQSCLPTARIFSHWQGGVLELDIGELCLSRMKWTKLQQVELEKKKQQCVKFAYIPGVKKLWTQKHCAPYLEWLLTQTTNCSMTHTPESPENFSPGFQLQTQAFYKVCQLEVGIPKCLDMNQEEEN